MMLTVKHERGETERRNTGKSMSVKVGPAPRTVFALMALGFAVYEFVHTEFSKGSLKILLGFCHTEFCTPLEGSLSVYKTVQRSNKVQAKPFG